MTNATNGHHLSEIKYLTNQLNIARNEVSNLRQQLKALTATHRKECEDIRRKLDTWRCSGCKNVEEQAQASSGDPNDFTFRYVGFVSTQFPEKRGTPRQPSVCSDLVAKLTLNKEVLTNPEHALEGLQEYSHMWILFHFDKNESTHVRAKVSPPRLNGIRTGVFATRSPHRPCPIGLSLVRIDRITENAIYFSGVDMVDRTPVLDIKPYIPQYDNPALLGNFGTFKNLNSSAENGGAMASCSTIQNENGSNSNNIDGGGVDLQQLNAELDNWNIRVMDGEENGARGDSAVIGMASSDNQGLRSDLDETFYSRSNSRIGEREAPDGEEEESPRQLQANTSSATENTSLDVNNVHVPSWIQRPPVSTLSVHFKDRALAQLQQLGAEGDAKKNIITNVLREDPRSVYLRERWGGHCYVFRIAELYVSCKFNDSTRSVTVYQAFQNSEAAEPDDL